MNRHFHIGLSILCVFALVGCDNSEKQKLQAEQEKTKQGIQVNAGNYTPVPLDLSMGTPASPTPQPEAKH